MKGHWKSALKIVLFVLIFILLALLLGKLFQPIWLSMNTYHTSRGFYEEPENTIETVFLGSSVGVEGIIPMRLYETHGLCTYNLCSEQQPMVASLHWLKEAYRLHPETLKTVLFDVSALRNSDVRAFARKTIDGMQLSPVKAQAVWEYADKDLEDTLTYLSPLLAYHTRWEQLNETDISKFTCNPVNGMRGYYYTDTSRVSDHRLLAEQEIRPNGLDTAQKPAKLVSASVAYMDRIYAFCREKGLKLVLIKTPMLSWNSPLHMAVEKWAVEYDVEFYDFNFEPLYNDINCFMPFDAHDNTHFNYYGAVKFTDWLGQYLTEQCDATDVRGKEGYTHMEEQYRLYRQTVLPAKLKGAADPTEYLALASEDGRKVTITASYGASAAMTPQQTAALKEMGLTRLLQLNEGETYNAVWENGVLLSEEVSPAGSLAPIDAAAVLQLSVMDGEGMQAIDTACFHTDTAPTRETYNQHTIAQMRSSETAPAPGSMQASILQYQQAQQSLTHPPASTHTDLCSLLAAYTGEPDTLILIAAKDEASRGLTQEDRNALQAYGLTELSQIGFRDSCVTVIDGGKVIYQERSQSQLTYASEDGKLQVQSVGFNAGKSKASIKLNNFEYAANLRGLNVLVYNKKTLAITEVAHFDTHAKQ